MSNKISIRTSVHKGKLKRNLPLILEAVSQFEGKECIITFDKPKKDRSNQQNRYYWGVVLPLVQHGLKDATGELRSVENIHYNILLKLFSPENEIVNIDTGECFTEKISSSEMTTVQFMGYILDIQKWSAEFLGINIPDPNEETTLNFEDV